MVAVAIVESSGIMAEGQLQAATGSLFNVSFLTSFEK